LGHLSANGHPHGGPWRQLRCSRGGGYVLETHGTIWPGTRVTPHRRVWAVGAWAEGLGIRAVARVFALDPHTVRQWLVEAADHRKAFAPYVRHDVHVTQVPRDALLALRSAVQGGEIRATAAIAGLSRAPQWGWVAMDPLTKWLLTLDVGDRTLAMAQCMVHQVAQLFAPDGVPLFLTDGFQESTTALLTHLGQWVQPPRCQANGPAPKPR
jgi:hypothetical protein